jgi:signal transduction histidine kinase
MQIPEDFQKLDRQTFDDERLIYAKQGVEKGVKRFGVPVEIFYGVADFFANVDNLYSVLFIRVATIACALTCLRLLSKIRAYEEYQRLYFVFVFIFSISTNYVVYLSGLSPGIYWAGLALVAFGGLGFYPFSRLFCGAQLLVLYVPALAMATRFGDEGFLLGTFSYLATFFIATAVILWMFRDFQERLLFIEIGRRLRLQREVDSKSIAIRDQESELGVVRNRLHQSEAHVIEVEAVAGLARQAAHDIRSPLSALSIVTRSLQSLSSEHRELAQAAIDRITKTAEELLAGSRATRARQKGPALMEYNQFLSVVGGVVSEKRALLGDSVELIVVATHVDIRARVLCEENTLARVVSNLLDNAIEASGQRQVIRLTVTLDARETRFIRLIIQDSGCGIPAEILENVGIKNFTHGKPGGNGLGVHFAKTTVEAWGGRFKISSSVGTGTIVELGLPTKIIS